jgi:hypothetical protein
VTNEIRVKLWNAFAGWNIHVPVKYLRALCDVRYWEDTKVNGIEDTNGDLIPCRDSDLHGDYWGPVIDLETGTIQDWPIGTTADVHYKVCDAGIYQLLDADKNVVKEIDGYVIKMMCPKDNGYGDYVIMKIDENGVIDGWKVNLSPFENDWE